MLNDFIILGSQRCGSTLLCNILNSQDLIRCHYEIFFSKHCQISLNDSSHYCISTTNKPYNYKILLRKFPLEVLPIHDYHLITKIYHLGLDTYRFKYPLEFITQFKNYCNKKFLGYKIFYDQIILLKNFDFIEYLKSNNIKVIHIDRQNKFLQELSYQKKQQTNIVRLNPNDKYKNIKIKFDIDLYQQRSSKKIQEYDKYNKLFIENNIQTINVNYETLENSYEDVYKFLTGNKDNYKKINSDLLYKKLNTFSLKDQIANFEEVKSLLRGDEFFDRALQNDIEKSIN